MKKNDFAKNEMFLFYQYFLFPTSQSFIVQLPVYLPQSRFSSKKPLTLIHILANVAHLTTFSLMWPHCHLIANVKQSSPVTATYLQNKLKEASSAAYK